MSTHYQEKQREQLFQLFVRLGNVQSLCNYCAENEGKLGFPPPHPNTVKGWKRKYGWEKRREEILEKARRGSDGELAGELTEVNEVVKALVKEGIDIFQGQLNTLKAMRKTGDTIDGDALKKAGLSMGVKEFKDLYEMMRLAVGEPTEITEQVERGKADLAVQIGEAVRGAMMEFFEDIGEREEFIRVLDKHLQLAGLVDTEGDVRVSDDDDGKQRRVCNNSVEG